MANVKICRRCDTELPVERFGIDRATRDGRASHCLECKRRAGALYRAANPEKHRAAVRASNKKHAEQRRRYRERNRDKLVEYQREYRAKNAERSRERVRRYRRRHAKRLRLQAREFRRRNAEAINAKRREWRKANPDAYRETLRREGERRRRRPGYRIEATIRARLHRCIRKGQKGGRTLTILGYGIDQLMAHLENCFLPGMTWQNYGEWHIDHVIPLSAWGVDSWDHPELPVAWSLMNLRPMWANDNLRKGATIDIKGLLDHFDRFAA